MDDAALIERFTAVALDPAHVAAGYYSLDTHDVEQRALDARLVGALRAHDASGVARALAAGANVDACSGRPLFVAADAGYERGVRTLLNAGAAHRERALRAAARRGYTSIVALLAAPSAAALAFAAAAGDAAAVDALLAAGADARADDSRALHVAALGGHASIVGRLAAAGADPLARDQAALLEAAARHDVPTVRALLDALEPARRARALRRDDARRALAACGIECVELERALLA